MPSDWKESGIKFRDFRHTHDGPESTTAHPKRKQKGCKRNGGGEHDYLLIDTFRSTVVGMYWHNYSCKWCGKKNVEYVKA